MVKRAALVAVVVLAACGGGSSSTTVNGTVSVPAAGAQIVHPDGSADLSCSTTSGFSDIRLGAQVRVTDESGTLLGTTELSVGTRQEDRCVLPFTVKVPGGKSFYQFEVSHRGLVSFSADDLKRQGGRVELTVG